MLLKEEHIKIYFNKFKVIPPEQQENIDNRKIVATILKNMEAYGYTMDNNLIDSLIKTSEEDLVKFYDNIISLIKKRVCYGITNVKPLFENFPYELMEEEKCEDYLLTINGYVENFDKYRLTRNSEVKEMFPLFNTVPSRVIRLGSYEDYLNYYSNLLKAKSSISEEDKYNLKYFIKTMDMKTIKSIIPEQITCKEVLASLTVLLVEKSPENIELVKDYYKTATDILRLAAALSYEDISLSDRVRFFKFKRPIRKMLLSLLDKCNKYSMVEDMNRNRGLWITLGEILHPGEYKKFKNVNYAFDKIRNDKKIETFNSKFEKMIAEEDIDSIISLLMQRPGEYARRLARLVRTFDDNRIIYGFATIASKVSSQVLLQVRQYFINQENQPDIRVFFPKGGITRAYGIENTQSQISKEKIFIIVNACDDALKSIYKQREPLGKVYIDPEMVNFVVPMSQRSASKSLLSVAKGSRFQLNHEAKIIRTFIYWKQSENSNNVDLDLSAVFYDENLNFVNEITYYNLSDKKLGCHHSGDVRSAKDGASEYIDLDVDKLKSNGIRFVASTINSYSSENFCDLPECFCGFMERTGEEGEVYDPKTVVNKSDISSAATQCLSCLIDLETMQVIWTDLAYKDSCTFNSNQSNNRNTTYMALKNVLSTTKPNIYDLAVLNAEARGEIVENKEDADVVVAIDGTLTPYDTDEIIANWI